MMYQSNWKNAYGQPTEEFHNELCQTLSKLTEPAHTAKSHKISVLLIAILILALFAGAAIAVNQLGLLRYLYRDQPPMEDSEEILTNLEAEASSEMLSASVEEALFDGKSLILTVRYRLTDPDRYYFGNSFVSEGVEQPKPNATPLYPWPPHVLVNGADCVGTTWQIESDGSMVLFNSSQLDVPENTQSIHVTIQNNLGGELNLEDIELDLNLCAEQRHAIVQPVGSNQGERFSIVSAELSLNSVLSYLEVEYSYQQASSGEEMGIVLWVYDANGHKIEEVDVSTKIFGPLENGNFRDTIALPYFQELPERLYLEAKVIGDTVKLGRIECQVIPQ